MLSITAGALFAVSLSACSVTTVGGGGGYSDPYKRAWYDVYGTQCISYGYPMSGCNFYASGSKIQLGADPYHNQAYMQPGPWTYTDSYGYAAIYYGSAWLSPTGILYDSYGNALNELDQADANSADIIAMAAAKEQQITAAAGKKFASEYALAEDKGIAIAGTLQDWATIGKDRSRTAQDMADIGKRLYGVDPTKAQTAIMNAMKGDQAGLVDLNVDVAAHWGTSPETSKAILSKWYKDEIATIGGLKQ
ncbi:MAG: hypothetical protein JST80_09085 [Bdellovibrionales bacterium]|nr:hypothetical protein [Bdellovibrionales bacterium]